jgi:hypothetical protein
MSKLDLEAGKIRLRRILAGYRYFSAHAKAILHQVRLPSAVNHRAVRFATEGVFRHTKEFLVTYVVKLPTTRLQGSQEVALQQIGRFPSGIWSSDQAPERPPKRYVACNSDVRVSVIGQLPCAAALACSGLLCTFPRTK